jgi:hypothetical protein
MVASSERSAESFGRGLLIQIMGLRGFLDESGMNPAQPAGLE